MKRYLLILCAIIAFSTVEAQEIAGGIKGGLNFPNIDGIGLDPDQIDSESASGFHGGVFLRVRLAKVAIQPEILFSQQNFDFQYDDPTFGEIDIEQRLSYAVIPIMLKYYFPAGLNVQVGPQFGFLLNAEQTDNSLGADTNSSIDDLLKSADLGVNAGIGIDLPFGLQLSGRYVLGVSDIVDVTVTDANGNIIDSATRNSMIQVSIGYSFLDIGR